MIPKKFVKLGPAGALLEQITAAHTSLTTINNAFLSGRVREQENPAVLSIQEQAVASLTPMNSLLEWAENNYLLERDSLNQEEFLELKKLCLSIKEDVRSVFAAYMRFTESKSQAFSFIPYLKDDFRMVLSCLSRVVSFLQSVERYV